jgi:hypothetical protein
MGRHRTTARALLLLLLVWASQATAQAAGAADRILFPIVGDVSYTDDFGDARPNGSHDGNDLVADRKAHVVAVEAGTVGLWTTSARAGCMLYLHGESGATYLYVHLNNDSTRKDDNRGKCVGGVAYAPGLKEGQHVRAGELIGFVGDSGDAEGGHPHLHFELHPGGGEAVSPFASLQEAPHLLFPLPRDDRATKLAAFSPLTLALHGTVRQTAEGTLTLLVHRIRMSNGWRVRVTREVVLAIPADALIVRSIDGKRLAAPLGSLGSGEKAVVWTAPVTPDLSSQLAEPGVLAAAQIVVRS